MMIACLVASLAATQAKAKTLDDYLKTVSAEARTALTGAIDAAVKDAQSAKNPDSELTRLGMKLDNEAKKHAWTQRMPVLTAALKGKQGHSASVILHVLAIRALTDGLIQPEEMDDFRTLNRIAIEAAAPYVTDKEASARLMAVNFLKAVADKIVLDKAKGKEASLHAPETRALIRKSLNNVTSDPNERIARWAKEGLANLDSVEK